MVPPASGTDDRGMDTKPRDRNATPAPPRSSRVVHVTGGIATVLAGAIAVVVAGLFSWSHSYCTPRDRSSDELQDLRVGLLVILVTFALVPLLVGLWARARRTHSAAWFAFAGVSVLYGVAAFLSAEQSQWCLF
jgi:hypothetical protein